MRWRWLLLIVPVLLLAVLFVPLLAVPLKAPEVPVATEVLDTNGVLITRLYEAGGGNRIQVPLTEISPYLQEGVISMEDREFYHHHGVNVVGIIRALGTDLLQRRIVAGGSTITQQLAKNLYTSGERTIRRKLLELVLTFKLESVFSKQEILAMYLNQIYLGHGTWGVEVASQIYFGKSAKDLDLAEAALIAGLPRNPEYYSPYNHPKESVDRRNLVLDTMTQLGYIGQAQADAAKQEPLHLIGLRPAGRQAPYFVDYVLGQLDPDLEKGVAAGGYRIFTTLDLNLQKAAEAAIAGGIKTKPDAQGVPQPEAALVAVDPTNGYIRAMVGGTDYSKTQYNRAVARRQPGSAFKPFLYAAVLSQETYTAASTQICEPVSFPGRQPGEDYAPTDFDPKQKYHYRPIGVREAIRISDNVVAVRWGDTMGPDRIVRTAQSMGITSPLQADLSLSLGSSAVTPVEMAGGYTPLANGGVRTSPLAVLRVVDRFGNVVADNRPNFANVLDPRVAYILTDIMKEVLQPGGTAGQTAAQIGGRPAAGKTGTTDHLADAWFVGYTPTLVAAVWVGNDNPAVPVARTGGQVAAPIWGSFIASGLQGQPMQDFSRPDGITEALVCDASGLVPNATCPSSHVELFLAGTEPTQVDPTIYGPPAGTPPPTPAPGLQWPFPVPQLPRFQPFPQPVPGTAKPGEPKPVGPSQPARNPAPAPRPGSPRRDAPGGPVPLPLPVPTPAPVTP
ncbi:MAG: transglycosylase domain-containing protein [Symbiobacteriia bacterium]